MKLCIISDTHGFENLITIPECDVLIHCGDFCSYGSKQESLKFLQWFCQQPAEHKLFIAGNHDICWEQDPAWVQRTLAELHVYEKNIHYLRDSGVEINEVKFWGSPWQPEFMRWAFNLPRGGNELYQAWEKVPRETDVLITHTPLKDILDRSNKSYPPYPQNAGCELLRHRVEEIGTIKLHCAGHIHEAQGGSQVLNPTYCINASICNRDYQAVNKPVEIDL